jgi:hypothetical protein
MQKTQKSVFTLTLLLPLFLDKNNLPNPLLLVPLPVEEELLIDEVV